MAKEKASRVGLPGVLLAGGLLAQSCLTAADEGFSSQTEDGGALDDRGGARPLGAEAWGDASGIDSELSEGTTAAEPRQAAEPGEPAHEPIPAELEPSPSVCPAGAGATVLAGNHLIGEVHGFTPEAGWTVTLGEVHDGFLRERVLSDSASYEFTHIPEGCYYLAVKAPGAVPPATRLLEVAGGSAGGGEASVGVFRNLTMAERLDLEVAEPGAEPGHFEFHWRADDSRAGYQADWMPRPPRTLTGLGEPVSPVELSAADTLAFEYNVNLVTPAPGALQSHAPGAWTDELAHRLLLTMRSIPQPRREFGPQTLTASLWQVTDEPLPQDIQIEFDQALGHRVLISSRAFVHSAPREARLDGDRGSFFSQRLYRALLRFATQGGRDPLAVERVLSEKHGLTTHVPGAEGSASCSDYAALTHTGEDCSRFQEFAPEELLEVMSMLALMPRGLQSTPELQALVRRADGARHPLYPQAAAVAWCGRERGYVELMESAFTSDPAHVHRLMLHEYSHCLFSGLDEGLREDWASAGGWRKDEEGRYTLTSSTTEFVSAYAHDVDYSEDFAESLAYYVLNPTALLSRAPQKFEFLRDRIMSGVRYLTQLDESASFEVLNLWPDYAYPGKVSGVDIVVSGEPERDKGVEITISLEQGGGAGAASAGYVRAFSEDGTFVDTWLLPLEGDPSRLRGELTINKRAASGCWFASSLTTWDAAGNQRFEGREDFGWRLCVENPLADSEPPRYVDGSLTLSVQDETVVDAQGEARPLQMVVVEYEVVDDAQMNPSCVYASLDHVGAGVRSKEAWGSYDEATGLARIELLLTEHSASGTWRVPYISFCDAAGHGSQQYFGGPGEPAAAQIEVLTRDPDLEPPELARADGADEAGSFEALRVSALPTHPEAPNGETLVTLDYYARDDKSGLGVVSYRFLDPLGTSHFGYHEHGNTHSVFFEGDPTAWQHYQLTVLLPAGSAPGTWGVEQLVLCDKAGNCAEDSFTETLIFTPDEDSGSSL